MTSGLFTSAFAEEEEEEQEAEDTSLQDGVPRYGNQLQPSYSRFLADEADIGRREPGFIAEPLDGREPGQEYGDADKVKDFNLKSGFSSYLYDDPSMPKSDPDQTSLTPEDLNPPIADTMSLGSAQDDLKYIRNTTNFLFGEDLAILGIQWDEYGLNASLDNMVDQWVESPVMSTVALAGLVASTVFPAIGAVRKSAKIGSRALSGASKYVSYEEKLSRLGEMSQRATKFDPQSGKHVVDFPMLGFKTTKGLKESSLLKHGDDWHMTMRDMTDVNSDIGTGAKKYFNDGDAAIYREMLDTGRGDEAINKFGKENLKKALLAQDAYERRKLLAFKVTNDLASPLEHHKYNLQKRFANTYFQLGSAMTPRVMSKITEFMENAQIWKPFAFEVPTEHHKAWTMAMAGVIKETDNSFKAIKNNPELYKVWQAQRTQYQRHHTKAQDLGFLTRNEVLTSGAPDKSLHIKAETMGSGRIGWSDGAVYRIPSATGSAEFEKARGLGKSFQGKVKAEPTLTSPSLQPRLKYRDPAALKAGYESGELIVDPGQVSQFSLMHDGMVLNTYDQIAEQAVAAMKLPRGVVDEKGWFKSAETISNFGPKAKRNWIDLNNLDEELELMGYGAKSGMAERVRRMIAVKMGKDLDDAGNIVGGMTDDMPWMNMQIFEDIFDRESGVFGATEILTDAMALAGGLHKTTATSLNFRTHVQNAAGNFIMLAMAGKNPFSKQAIKDMKESTSLFTALAKRKVNDNIDPDALFSAEELMKAMESSGFERYMTTKAGSTIDMVEVLSHPTVGQLIEKSAFQSAEGMGNVKRMLDAIDSVKDPTRIGLGTKAMAKVTQALTGIGRVNKKGQKAKFTKFVEWNANTYMMEDMVPKMMYFQDLMRSGMSIDAAVMEVGRRLPQYATVGKTLKGARKKFLPWVTFPAEMTRIMKNNLQDYPLRTAAMLRAPAMMQTIFQDTLGPATQEELTDAMREAPIWAQKGTTVLLEGGQATAATLAGSTGAFVGATIGGASAGVMGAMVGAAAGGAAGAAAGYNFTDADEKNMRAWTMDFLPWGSLSPGSTSPEAEPGTSVRAWMDLSPVEPYAVLMPLVNVMMGVDDFGREIPVTGPQDAMQKSLMAFAGFLSPPMMQKYGMRVGEPDTGLFDLSGAGERLGAAAIGAGLGAAASGPKGAAVGGLTGALIGANTSRLQEDLGLKKNMYTGREGNWVYDVALNSFLGVGVSYKATPEQRIFNERRRREEFGEVRKIWQKQADYAILNGDDDMLHENMAKIGRSFTAEYLDPAKATEKFGEYVKRRWDKLGRHPQLRGIPDEKLDAMLDQALVFASKHRTEAMERKVRAIQEEIYFREMTRESEGLNVGGYDFDINTATGLRRYLTPGASKKSKRRNQRSGGAKGFF